MRLSTDASPPRTVGAVIGGLGVVLASTHALHAVEEAGTDLSAVFYGSVLPFAVAVGILTVGLWIDRREWTGVSPWRLVGWCGAGAAVTLLLALLLIQYQLAEGVVPEDRGFVSLMFVTYGAGVGLVVGVYDVRIRETQAALTKKTRRLDEFASIVSHDLRNPLNVAQGYVERSRETGDVSDLETVTEAHQRMDAILADMLALAQNGQRAVSQSAVELDTAAEQAWAMVPTGDATLTVTDGVTIRADPGRLKTLFENLFRNSVEHSSTDNRTESGDSVEHGSTNSRARTGNSAESGSMDGRSAAGQSPTDGAPAPVDVTVGRLDDGSGFFVEDTGPGIPPEYRERVFEAAFTTGDGSGLGLAIVRAAADAHGWSHSLTESETGGARFEFRDVTVVDD